jgi:hypothetical protein
VPVISAAAACDGKPGNDMVSNDSAIRNFRNLRVRV